MAILPITKDNFEQVVEALLNVSVRMKQDLKGAVVQLGKALNDPIANMSALSRTGIQFTVQQKDMIKVMVESGNLMGAQRIILKELANQFGGSAVEKAKTFTGQIIQMTNAFSDFLRIIGERIAPKILEITKSLKLFFESRQGAIFAEDLAIALKGIIALAKGGLEAIASVAMFARDAVIGLEDVFGESEAALSKKLGVENRINEVTQQIKTLKKELETGIRKIKFPGAPVISQPLNEKELAKAGSKLQALEGMLIKLKENVRNKQSEINDK